MHGGAFSGGGGTTGAAVADATVMPIIVATISDGRDGDCHMDGINEVPFATLSGGVYTCWRVPLPTDWTVYPLVELRLANFAGPWATGDAHVWGRVTQNGNDAIGSAAGVATAAQTQAATHAGGAGGAASTNGAQAPNATVEGPVVGNRFAGVPGGAGVANAGGVAAAVTALSVTRGVTHGGPASYGAALNLSTAGAAAEQTGPGGSGGGGGPAAAGGGGGASGGNIDMSGRSLTVHAGGSIECNGGAGAAGLGAGAGGGSGGSGGRFRGRFGSVSLADPLLSVQAYGGAGGTGGGSGGLPGWCGGKGVIVWLAGAPEPLATRHYRVDYTATELASFVVGGVADVSGTFVVGADAGTKTALASTSAGCAGFAVSRLDTPDGELSLRFNPASGGLDLRVRGVVVLSTQDVDLVPSGGATYQPFAIGDRIDWRYWYDPAGGARSMGIRWFVNRTGGYDEVGVASGAALAAPTAGTAVSASPGAGTSGPAPAYILASRAADVVGTVVMMGDSITAPKGSSFGRDGVSVASRIGWTTQVCISLSKPGGRYADQQTRWLASPMRGDPGVVAVIWQLGHNDMGTGGLTEAQVLAAAQDLNDDIAANNPTAKRIVSKMTPSRNAWDDTQWAEHEAIQADYDGSGSIPLVGPHAVAGDHVATMGDANGALRYGSESVDRTHPEFVGRSLNARSIRAAYDSLGLAA